MHLFWTSLLGLRSVALIWTLGTILTLLPRWRGCWGVSISPTGMTPPQYHWFATDHKTVALELPFLARLCLPQAVALLSLGPCFTEAELYHEITQLSYRGDIRMSIGEDPKKVWPSILLSFRASEVFLSVE